LPVLFQHNMHHCERNTCLPGMKGKVLHSKRPMCECHGRSSCSSCCSPYISGLRIQYPI
jgi:hypothetical protein